MNTHADKTQETKSQSVANTITQKQSGGEFAFQFVDNRPEAIAQRRLQEMANNSTSISQLGAFQDMANNSTQVKQAAQIQAKAKNLTAQEQLHSELLGQAIQKKSPIPTESAGENNTGITDTLKTGIENLSGMSMDDVKVHRNSDNPAQLQAQAYAQETDVHLSPGQEKHMPHEASNAAQQKQGRVKPTVQMKGNENEVVGFEKEADVMGSKALQMRRDIPTKVNSTLPNFVLPQMSEATTGVLPVQCYRDWKELYKTGWKYSGGTMATHSNLGGLWHASVFRVDKDGNSKADGLFTQGFHLTMEGAGPLPHVFFDDMGDYQAQMTTAHPQTVAYKLLVGAAVLENDIENAKALSGQALAFLGPEIEEDQRLAMEDVEKQKEETAKEAEEQALQIAAAKFAEEQVAAAAQPEDENASLDWLLKDAGFSGVLTHYRNQLKGYLEGDGKEEAITYKKLIPLAKWYMGGKKANWPINEPPKALYTGWNKVPNVIDWTNYANSTEIRKRGPSQTGIPSEFRFLSFNGYASYRLHPKATKPKKV